MAITTPVETTTARRRISAYDGLRGIAIVLVVLSHGWTIWPTTQIVKNDVLEAFFTGGDFAVSVFFVIGAFLATQAMLRGGARDGALRPGVLLTRRWIRVSGQMYALLLVVLLVAVLDTTDTYPQTATRESVFRAATYTWNWYAKTNAFEARPDLGHLWYLSVDMQMFVVILCLVWLLRRHRAWLLAALIACFVVLVAWRHQIYDVEGPYSALLRTWARGDAPLAGAVAAAAVPYLKRFRAYATPATVVALVALVPIFALTSTPEGYFGTPGVLLDVAVAVFAAGCAISEPNRFLTVSLGSRPLRFLGRHSLSLYVWHYPIFWFIARHSADWHWQARTALALAITAVAATLSTVLVERRIQRWLASPAWAETDDGLGRYVVRRARRSAVTAGQELRSRTSRAGRG